MIYTKDNLHNFHFKESSFFDEKVKKKYPYIRQLIFDTKGIQDVWFLLDDELNLYYWKEGDVYFGSIVFIKQLSKNYLTAIGQLAKAEVEMINKQEALILS